MKGIGRINHLEKAKHSLKMILQLSRGTAFQIQFVCNADYTHLFPFSLPFLPFSIPASTLNDEFRPFYPAETIHTDWQDWHP